MTTDEITDLLTGAYIDELETVMNYQTNAIVLDGIHAEEVKASLEEDIQEELGHAKMLGERLKQLDESPPGSESFEANQHSLQPPEDTTDVQSVIEGVLEAEESAIETYRSLIEAATDANDPVTEGRGGDDSRGRGGPPDRVPRLPEGVPDGLSSPI